MKEYKKLFKCMGAGDNCTHRAPMCLTGIGMPEPTIQSNIQSCPAWVMPYV